MDGDEQHGDEKHYVPIEMKVWRSYIEHGILIVLIERPSEMKPGSVDHNWTGVFTSDGKPIPGTNFVVYGVIGHEITVRYPLLTLPSRTVRMFQPGTQPGSK